MCPHIAAPVVPVAAVVSLCWGARCAFAVGLGCSVCGLALSICVLAVCPGAVTCLGGCLAGGSCCCCVGLAELWVSLASLATAWRRWSGVFLRLCVFQGLSVFVGPAPSSLASLRCLGCLGGRFVVLGECWVVEGL